MTNREFSRLGVGDMKIANNIIKEHLKNVYFLCGGAYGGKTTMAKLLEEKHGFIRYRQGDHER